MSDPEKTLPIPLKTAAEKGSFRGGREDDQRDMRGGPAAADGSQHVENYDSEAAAEQREAEAKSGV
ncbi:hypothetical protein BH09MYX1_BH09MYX1_05560 [soil metagenome]